MFKTEDLFDLTQTEHAAIFDGGTFAWEALKKIEAYLGKVPKQNPPQRFPGASIGDRVIFERNQRVRGVDRLDGSRGTGLVRLRNGTFGINRSP